MYTVTVHRPRVIQFSFSQLQTRARPATPPADPTSPDFDSEPCQGQHRPSPVSAISSSYDLPGNVNLTGMHHPTRTSPRQPKVHNALYVSLHRSHCIGARGGPALAGRPPAHRSAQPSADGPLTGNYVHFLVQPATPQTPTAPALEPLPPKGMAALCFENSTASVINDIVCRAAAEADGRMAYMIVAQVGGHDVATSPGRTTPRVRACMHLLR